MLARGVKVSHQHAQQVLEQHKVWLMSLPNVNGVGLEVDPTNRSPLITVFVARMIPDKPPRSHEAVPMEIDGVPVRLRDIGQVSAQEN